MAYGAQGTRVFVGGLTERTEKQELEDEARNPLSPRRSASGTLLRGSGGLGAPRVGAAARARRRGS